ncbi:unnamed protein product, partial [Iphiclides podalirius]
MTSDCGRRLNEGGVQKQTLRRRRDAVGCRRGPCADQTQIHQCVRLGGQAAKRGSLSTAPSARGGAQTLLRLMLAARRPRNTKRGALVAQLAPLGGVSSRFHGARRRPRRIRNRRNISRVSPQDQSIAPPTWTV